jgi:hypothetical protein
MADDLASRISDGAVAVLELAPGEQRFADLSNYVLRGGASRFAPVVLDDEHLRYVLPVGIPAAKLDYGTLLIQKTRCALVWRSEPSRPYHALITELGPETTVAQTPVTVRGEVWGRFDLRRPGLADMTFLVPPVASTALPRMLHRVLIDEPGSKQGRIEAAPLTREVIEGLDDAPSEVVDDAPAESDRATAVLPAFLAASPAPSPQAGSLGGATAATTAAAPSQAAASVDSAATQVLTPTLAAPATPAAPPPVAAAPPTWAPRKSEPEASLAPYRDGDLYREATRTTPVTTQPAIAPPGRAATTTATGRSREVEHVPAYAQPGLGDPVKGFLTGFVATVVVGGLFVLAKVMGLLG